MTISNPYKGTILLTADYQMIYPTTTDLDVSRSARWHEGWIYFHELLDGDEVMVKIDEYDEEGQQHRTYDIQTIKYTASPPSNNVTIINNVPACHIAGVLTGWLRVYVKQTAGSPNYKNINYKFYEVY